MVTSTTQEGGTIWDVTVNCRSFVKPKEVRILLFRLRISNSILDSALNFSIEPPLVNCFVVRLDLVILEI
jgi:hypothetical protein